MENTPNTPNTPVVPNPPSACPDHCGTLPECAPLAVPYVPFQQQGSKQYGHREALNNGTLFPGLNLPFHVKVKPGDVANSALGELQALQFVLLELGLYLDTHKDDAEAFAVFQRYATMEKEARKRYEAENGPLFQRSTASSDSYNWLCDPWPWNFMEGGNK